MQTAVAASAIGRAGQLYDLLTAANGDVVPGTNEEAANPIPFGCLAQSSSADGVKQPTTLAQVQAARGVLVIADEFDLTQLADVTVNTNVQSGIKPGVTAGFLRKGRILVIPEATGTEASAVRVRIVAGAGNNITLGAFTPTADVGKTVSLGAAARWLNGGPVANTPSVLEIDCTQLGLATAD